MNSRRGDFESVEHLLAALAVESMDDEGLRMLGRVIGDLPRTRGGIVLLSAMERRSERYEAGEFAEEAS